MAASNATSSAAGTTVSIVWNTWASTTNSTATAWSGWITNTSGAGGASSAPYWRPAPAETDEQRAERAARCAAQAAAERERVEKEKAATERAEELLLSHLTGRQRRQYQKNKTFTVRGRDGHRYLVTPAWAGHVFRLNDRFKPVERFCIHPVESVPVPDNQLIAKLMLATDPARFRLIANVTPLAA